MCSSTSDSFLTRINSTPFLNESSVIGRCSFSCYSKILNGCSTIERKKTLIGGMWKHLSQVYISSFYVLFIQQHDYLYNLVKIWILFLWIINTYRQSGNERKRARERALKKKVLSQASFYFQIPNVIEFMGENEICEWNVHESVSFYRWKKKEWRRKRQNPHERAIA